MSKKIELNDKLIFSRFGSLTEQREALYLNFIDIDEKEEISKAWVEFSGNVVNDLLSVGQLTKNLYDRLLDGLRRSQQKPGVEDLKKVKSLTEFWLDLSIMSYLYSTIEKRGIFGEGGSKNINHVGYIETKKSIHQLILLAFQAGNEFFSVDSRLTLGEELYLSQLKQRLDYMDTHLSKDDIELHKTPILGDYNLKQADFLLNRVRNSLIVSSSTWWWSDPIAMSFSSTHAIQHIKAMSENYASLSSDLHFLSKSFSNVHLLPTITFSNLSLAQHYKRLGISALLNKANHMAASYFNEAMLLLKNLNIEDLSTEMRNYMDFWSSSAHLQWLIFEQMAVLSEMAIAYEKIISLLNENKVEQISPLLEENLEKLSVMFKSGDVAYLTSIGVAYETIFSYIKSELAHSDKTSVIEFVEARINIVVDRLKAASYQLINSWVRSISKDTTNLEVLQDIMDNLEMPLLGLLVLPSKLNLQPLVKEILSITTATEVLEISEMANEEFGLNPVKEMLMRAKAFKLAINAENYLKDVPDADVVLLVRNLIYPMKMNNLIKGLISEIQLKSAVIQFDFVNVVASVVENAVASRESDEQKSSDENILNKFSNDAELITLACSTILENKVPIEIKGNQVNWSIFETVYQYTNTLNLVVKSVILAINALHSKDRSDKIINWEEAKDVAQKAADGLKPTNQTAAALSEQLFSLTQMYRNNSTLIRDEKKLEPFPTSGIITLINELVMSI